MIAIVPAAAIAAAISNTIKTLENPNLLFIRLSIAKTRREGGLKVRLEAGHRLRIQFFIQLGVHGAPVGALGAAQ